MLKHFSLLFVLLIAACGDNVPAVSDPHNIVVDGQKMTQAAFLQKYCVSAIANKTCAEVKNALNKDATRGQVPKGW